MTHGDNLIQSRAEKVFLTIVTRRSHPVKAAGVPVSRWS
jgi:hypothetical protein